MGTPCPRGCCVILERRATLLLPALRLMGESMTNAGHLLKTFSITLIIFPAFLLQGCVDFHSHCAESTDRQVMVMVCDMKDSNGNCIHSSLETETVSTCLRSECDEGYELIGDKCVATAATESAPPGGNATKAQLDIAARNRHAYLSKMESCKGWKLLSNANPTASSLIGESLCGDRMQTWLATMSKSQPTGTPSEPNFYPVGPAYQLEFPSRGISLFFSSDTDKLGSEAIYFDAMKPGIKTYEGKLPLGLSFQDTRKQIETILGRADSSGGIPAVGWQALYGSKGMIIVYKGERDDPSALMRYMIISKKLR